LKIDTGVSMEKYWGTPNFEYEFNTKDSICIVKGVGEINLKESIAAMIYVANHKDFRQNFKIVVDNTGMIYHPSFNDLLGIVSMLKQLKSSFQNKIAIVTQPKMSVVTKLVEVYCELADMKVKSFTKVEKALLWINELDK